MFYSVPHAGSRLADWGWYLRYVGGAPAGHVRHLKTGQSRLEVGGGAGSCCCSFAAGLLAWCRWVAVKRSSPHPTRSLLLLC